MRAAIDTWVAGEWPKKGVFSCGGDGRPNICGLECGRTRSSHVAIRLFGKNVVRLSRIKRSVGETTAVSADQRADNATCQSRTVIIVQKQSASQHRAAFAYARRRPTRPANAKTTMCRSVLCSSNFFSGV